MCLTHSVQTYKTLMDVISESWKCECAQTFQFISFRWSTAKIAIKKTSHHTQIQASSFSRVCLLYVLLLHCTIAKFIRRRFGKNTHSLQPHSDELNVVFSVYSSIKIFTHFSCINLILKLRLIYTQCWLFYDGSLRIEWFACFSLICPHFF